MNEYKQTWLFQANSMVWIGFSEQFKQNTVGATGDWTVSRYWKEIDSGDRVLLWEVGSNARLLAIGELTGKPFEGKVPFRFTYILTEPIPRSTFLEDPVLKNMLHIRAPQGSNFKVTEEEWKAVKYADAISLCLAGPGGTSGGLPGT